MHNGIRASIASVTALLLTVTASVGESVAVGEPPHADPAFETLPAIVDAIERHGAAGVVVSLELDGGSNAAGPAALEHLRRSVDVAQDAVLASVARRDAGDEPLAIRHRYEAVPALAATVRSLDGLAQLVDGPGVIGVRLDDGGVGALADSVPLIAIDERHAVGNLGDGITVAVLDSGVDLDHPDLVDDVLPAQACFGDDDGAIDGNGFCPDGSDRQTGSGAGADDAGHGTHVAGIVTSAGTVGAPGAAPGAEIISIKVTDDCSFSGCFRYFSEVVAALDWIITDNDTLGVDLVNMSLITNAHYEGNCDAAFPAAATAIATLRSMGITAFASSGNSGTDEMTAPACLSQVISVGATDDSDAVAGFTDSNETTDVFAPGVGIASLAIGGGTTSASGTSMASPHAAGCAALLLESGEATTPAAIDIRLETSTVRLTNGAGSTTPRLDCRPDEPPVADIGGPYAGVEGTAVTLDASGSSDPEGAMLTYAWDLDDDGQFDDATGPNPDFERVGRDGPSRVAVRVEDSAGLVDTDSTDVSIANVGPAVTVETGAFSGSRVTIRGAIVDPGWLDPLTATVDWGDGGGPRSLDGTVEQVRPDATLEYAAGHTYGSAKTFTIEVCGSDDDTTTCQTMALTVDTVTGGIGTTGALVSEVARRTPPYQLALIDVLVNVLVDGVVGAAYRAVSGV